MVSFQMLAIRSWSQTRCLASLYKIASKGFWQKDPKSFTELPIISLFFCFPWAKVWKNINFLVIYHTSLFYVKFLQKCHQLSNFWFELFFFITLVIFNSCIFFLLWAGINPIFWKMPNLLVFEKNPVNHLEAWQQAYFEK